jgi:hypothetical protein
MTRQEARDSALADHWCELLRGQARRAMRQGGASDVEVETFLRDYESQVAEWRRNYLARLAAERQAIAEGEFHRDALTAWEPSPEAGDRTQ